MREKKLLTAFFLAHSLDTISTWIGINIFQLTEGNPTANLFMTHNNPESAIIFKFAITSLLILFYAIAKSNESRFTFSTEKALQITTALTWVIVISNLLIITDQIT